MQPPDLARAARRIEEMSTADGSVLDCLAGSILRIFVRLNEIEAMNARIMHKLTALEAAKAGNVATAVSATGMQRECGPRAADRGDDEFGAGAVQAEIKGRLCR
jgi:hypothetical protein